MPKRSDNEYPAYGITEKAVGHDPTANLYNARKFAAVFCPLPFLVYEIPAYSVYVSMLSCKIMFCVIRSNSSALK